MARPQLARKAKRGDAAVDPVEILAREQTANQAPRTADVRLECVGRRELALSHEARDPRSAHDCRFDAALHRVFVPRISEQSPHGDSGQRVPEVEQSGQPRVEPFNTVVSKEIGEAAPLPPPLRRASRPHRHRRNVVEVACARFGGHRPQIGAPVVPPGDAVLRRKAQRVAERARGVRFHGDGRVALHRNVHVPPVRLDANDDPGFGQPGHHLVFEALLEREPEAALALTVLEVDVCDVAKLRERPQQARGGVLPNGGLEPDAPAHADDLRGREVEQHVTRKHRRRASRSPAARRARARC